MTLKLIEKFWKDTDDRKHFYIGGQIVPRFKTMAELEAWAYRPLYQNTELDLEQITKADDPFLTTESAIFTAIKGKEIWTAVNTEVNGFQVIGRKPHQGRGARLLKNLNTPANSGVAEGATTIPDSVTSDYDNTFSVAPKIHLDIYEVGQLLVLEESFEDAIDSVGAESSATEMRHIINLDTSILKDADTLASNNWESIDRVVSSKSEEDALLTAGDADYAGYDRSAAANSFFDAVVKHASGVDRDFTLPLIDNLFQSIWEQGQMMGGLPTKPTVCLSDYDLFVRAGQLLESERRFFENGAATASVNGVRSVAPEGVEGAFHVKSYNGAPWIQAGRVPADTISRFYALNLDTIWNSILLPTVIIDDGGSFERPAIFVHKKLTKKVALQTIGNLRCPVPRVQGKIRDLQ